MKILDFISSVQIGKKINISSFVSFYTTKATCNTNVKFAKRNERFAKMNPLDPLPAYLAKVEGIDKLRRLITKELTSETSDDKCSNLPHLLSIVTCILRNSTKNGTSREKSAQPPPSAVLKPYSYSHGKSKRFIIDIVSSDGMEWCKVSARNPKSLNLLAAGGGGFGQKSILDHALDYIECAKQNPCFFKPPKIKFIFTSGISASLADELITMGLTIEGELIQDSELRVHPRIKSYRDYQTKPEDEEEEEIETNSNEINDKNQQISTNDDYAQQVILSNPSLKNVTRLNLDIPALLAYVSNLTNGHTNVQFEKPILKQQLEFEKLRPQKCILEQIFHGRELWCCQTALREFQSILSTVGGRQERLRAAEFLKKVKVVPDQMSERAKSLEITGNVKLRSLMIFGTGDHYEAVTVTANSGFVRSAKTQGVDFPVFLHESRALTEGKEKDLFLDLDLCELAEVKLNQ